jgi:hypothetical protein
VLRKFYPTFFCGGGPCGRGGVVFILADTAGGEYAAEDVVLTAATEVTGFLARLQVQSIKIV